MVRTIISLADADKTWLDERARELGRPMTELVREALTLYRQHEAARGARSLGELLAQTAGMRSTSANAENGLVTQTRLRDEWDKRPGITAAPRKRYR